MGTTLCVVRTTRHQEQYAATFIIFLVLFKDFFFFFLETLCFLRMRNGKCFFFFS
jgi:hypothetical protein